MKSGERSLNPKIRSMCPFSKPIYKETRNGEKYTCVSLAQKESQVKLVDKSTYFRTRCGYRHSWIGWSILLIVKASYELRFLFLSYVRRCTEYNAYHHRVKKTLLCAITLSSSVTPLSDSDSSFKDGTQHVAYTLQYSEHLYSTGPLWSYNYQLN